MMSLFLVIFHSICMTRFFSMCNKYYYQVFTSLLFLRLYKVFVDKINELANSSM